MMIRTIVVQVSLYHTRGVLFLLSGQKISSLGWEL